MLASPIFLIVIERHDKIIKSLLSRTHIIFVTIRVYCFKHTNALYYSGSWQWHYQNAHKYGSPDSEKLFFNFKV